MVQGFGSKDWGHCCSEEGSGSHTRVLEGFEKGPGVQEGFKDTTMVLKGFTKVP